MEDHSIPVYCMEENIYHIIVFAVVSIFSKAFISYWVQLSQMIFAYSNSR